MCGPCSASPVHSSFGRDASNRPKACRRAPVRAGRQLQPLEMPLQRAHRRRPAARGPQDPHHLRGGAGGLLPLQPGGQLQHRRVGARGDLPGWRGQRGEPPGTARPGSTGRSSPATRSPPRRTAPDASAAASSRTSRPRCRVDSDGSAASRSQLVPEQRHLLGPRRPLAVLLSPRHPATSSVKTATTGGSPRIPAHRGAAQSQLVLATRGGHEGASSSPQVTAAASPHRATAPTPGTMAATAAAAATAATASAASDAGQRRQRRVHHQAGRQRGEHRPDLLRPPAVNAAASPAPSRPGGPAAPRSPGAHHRRPFASNASPITSPASARRARHHAGSSTCVTPHPRHRALRRQNHTSLRPAQQPQPPLRRVPPPGQHAPARRACQLPASQLPLDRVPVSVYREHDASNQLTQRRSVSGCQDEEAGGPHPDRRDHRAVAHEKGQPEGCPQTPSAPSVTQPGPYILIPNDRRHPPRLSPALTQGQRRREAPP